MPPSNGSFGGSDGPFGRESHTPVPSVPATETSRDDPIARLLEQVTEEPAPHPLLSHRTLRGRCAIVTGGSTGIGRAIAVEFARHGVHVAFTWFDYDGDVDIRAAADETMREITQLEVRVHCEECDVREPEAVQGFVDRSIERLGGLHFLVNNAGVFRDRALWRLTPEQWGTVVDTNLTGAFNMIRTVAPHFRSQRDGKIVNIASVHALRSDFGLANYSASKAGLIALTKSAALELGPSNVNVNAVAPGFIRSNRSRDGIAAEILDRAREKSALGRLGESQDVANFVVFLCSEMARHVTGAVIPIDGGHAL